MLQSLPAALRLVIAGNHDLDRFNPTGFPRPCRTYPFATSVPIIEGDISILMTHGPSKFVLDNVSFGHVHGQWGTNRGIQFPYPDAARSSSKDSNADRRQDSDNHCTLGDVGKKSSRRKGLAWLGWSELQRGQETVFVNGAIEDKQVADEQASATNARWLATLVCRNPEECTEATDLVSRFESVLPGGHPDLTTCSFGDGTQMPRRTFFE